MLVFGQSVEDLEEECDFRITKDTTNFLVGFFGFYPYAAARKFESFILEAGSKDIANHDKIKNECFVLNGELCIEVHEQCGSGTFDISIILPKTFKTEKEALNWFKRKLKESKNLSESDICSINVIDGDKLIDFIKKETSIENKKSKAKAEIEEELKNFKKVLLESYKGDGFANKSIFLTTFFILKG